MRNRNIRAKDCFKLRRKRVMEYADYLGMDLTGPDKNLLWLAEEGLNAALPQVKTVTPPCMLVWH
jgi:hypothetical protein